LFTIIIPTYNSSALITKCLESICVQAFNNFEVIIVDGLSKDNTLQLAETYRHKLPSLRISSEKDQGIYDAMNKGIELAKGEWLYFMGSDDYFYSNDVLLKISQAVNNNLDVIYGNVYDQKLNSIYDGEFSDRKLFYINICHQSIFFNKELFKKIGNYNLQYTFWADWDHNFRWFYNKQISKKHINLTISYYSTGGFSSNITTDNFSRIKKEKYLELTGKKIKMIKLNQFFYNLRNFLKLKKILFN